MPELPMVGDEFAGFRLRAVLGRGGMSVVYQAENPRLGSVIALKVLAPELATDDAFRARFLEESRIAASLNHPNVIPIYDVGSSGALLYIAMRYVSGTDLRQMIKKRGRILPATALSLVGQAARALDAAHRRGLVHRDVKPGNLLIERGIDDEPDHVYLADFGITKHAMSRSGLTSTGQFRGTVDYVAPEQILGMPVLGPADQYSLGCVMYECLSGRVPFEKDLDAAIIWAHVEKSPTLPTDLRPELPTAVNDVFSRVLAKQSGDRYGSCHEFIEALRVALGGLATEPLTFGSTGSRTAGPHAGGIPGSFRHEPPPEPPADTGAAEPQAVRADQTDGMTSHGRKAGGAPPGEADEPDGRQPAAARPGPRRFLRPSWIAALTALILIAAGVGIWALVRGGSASHAPTAAKPSMSAQPKAPTSELMSAIILANESGAAKGLLPPSSCKQQSATVVICTAPAPGISGAIFRTYPSLEALYAAYTTQALSLNSDNFQENFQDCEPEETYGEVGWNHQFEHPKNYSIAQMSAGMVTDAQAAGRVFCNYNNGRENFLWTQDDGHLLAYVAGPVHEDVWNWWYRVHHNIGFSGPSMHM